MALFLYRSSAGSGKTYTLVKEYLKIVLKDPDRFRHVLAITFTNKAAGEMKERIIQALKQLAQGQVPELEVVLKEELPAGLDLAQQSSQVLNLLLHHYSDFAVSTIDSFMFRVINSFALELDLPLNFRVDLNHQQICTYVADTLMAQVGVDRQVTDIILRFVFSRASQDRSWYIEDEVRKFEEQLFNERNLDWIEAVGVVELTHYHRFIDQLNHIVRQFVNRLRDLGQRGIGSVREIELPVKKGSPADFLQKIADLEMKDVGSLHMYKSFRENRWYALSAPADQKARFDALLDSGLADIRDQVLATFDSRFEDACTAGAILVNIYLLAIVKRIKMAVDAYKSEFGLVPISEFNQRVNRVVRESPVPFIYAIIGDKFSHYLIDEFQDTNTLQWQNLLPLVEDSLAYNAFNMAVGDGKQSIYRWRGSNIDILQKDILSRFKGPRLQLRSLSRNYRSRDHVVEFNNRFFSGVVSELKDQYPLIGTIYNEVIQEPLGRDGGLVTVEFFSDSRESEEQILNKLGQLIPQVISRGYRYRDVCVLVREKKSGALVADYLLNNDIPVISTDSLKLAGSPLIQFIIEAIKVLINPTDKIAKAALTFFPYVYGMQEEAVLIRRQREPADDAGKYTWPPLEEFFSRRHHLIRLPVYELVEELVRIFSLSSLENDHALILGFMDVVAQYVRENADDMASFLEWWEFNCGEFALAIPEEKDAVKILTIHKAKGLEFPVVIIPFSDWSSRMDDKLWLPAANEIVDNPLIRLPLLVNSGKKLRETGFKEAYFAESEMVKVDNLNLLYVAMTRAIDELHLMSNKPDSSLLHSFAINWMDRHGKTERYTFGQIAGAEQRGSRNGVPYLQVEELISHPWHQRLTIRQRAEEFWRFDSSYRVDKAKWGILVHQILAEVKHEGEVEQVLEQHVESGEISIEEREHIEQIFSRMFAIPQVLEWFDPSKTILTEVSILTGKEEVRLDRIILSGKGATIVDFKTGQEKEADVYQIKKYRQVVEDMGYAPIQAYLFYLDNLRIKGGRI